jgi:flagellum-specific peptidoglycan hydrolase FlgJ
MAIPTFDLGPERVNTFGMLSGLGDTLMGIAAQQRQLAEKQQEREALNEIASATLASLGGQVASAPQAAGSLTSLAPNGKLPTFAAMSGNTPSASLTGDKEAFVRSIMPHAIEASKATGVDPRIIVAQAALESGWGAKAPGNNLFGIKSHGQPGGQTLATTEVVNGQPVRTTDSFRTFGSPAESVKGYADFINSNPRYAGLKAAQGLEGQAAALQASGYATDPQYGAKVGAIARSLPAADAPAPGAQPAQGFAIPGQNGGAGVSLPPHITALLQSSNPQAKAAGVQQAQAFMAKVAELQLQQQMKPREQWRTFRDEQGNVWREEVTTGKREIADRSTLLSEAELAQRLQLAEAGRSQTNVNLPSGEKSYDTTVGKSYGDTFVEIQKSGRSAQSMKNSLRLMERLTHDPNFYSGFGAGFAGQANRALTALGIKDAKVNGPNEVFTSIANELTYGKLGGSLGTGTSNADVGFIQQMAPQLANTREGNRMLISITGKIADRQEAVAKKAREYAASHGGRIDAGFDDELAAWAEANPLFTEADYQAAQEAMQGEKVGQLGTHLLQGTPLAPQGDGGWQQRGQSKIRLKPGQ